MTLSIEEKRDIWEMGNNPDIDKTQSDIAEKFGVSQARISQIVNEPKEKYFDVKTQNKQPDKKSNIDVEGRGREGNKEINKVEKSENEDNDFSQDDFSFDIESNSKPEVNKSSDIQKAELPSDEQIEDMEISISDNEQIDKNVEKLTDLDNEQKTDIEQESTEALLKLPSELYPILASIVGYENFDYSGHFNDDFDRKIKRASKFLHPYIKQYVGKDERMRMIIGIILLGSAYVKPTRELYNQYKKENTKKQKTKKHEPEDTERQETPSKKEKENNENKESNKIKTKEITINENENTTDKKIDQTQELDVK